VKRALSLALSQACVRAARKRQGGNMCKLERSSGISRGALIRVASGHRELSMTNLVRIARGLRMLPSDLLREAEAYVEGDEARAAVLADRKGRAA
jgi:transcriptional regulator with XRE-family HTH domain